MNKHIKRTNRQADMRTAYKAKVNTTKHKKQQFNLTLEQWETIWDERWEQRGTKKSNYKLVRIDSSKAWQVGNVEVVTSSESSHRSTLQIDRKAAGIKLRKYKDDNTQILYRAFVQQRNQAQFRKEGWSKKFTFEVWLDIWGDKISNKGRSSSEYCMTRINLNKQWTANNVIVLTRSESQARNVKIRNNIRDNLPKYKGTAL